MLTATHCTHESVRRSTRQHNSQAVLQQHTPNNCMTVKEQKQKQKCNAQLSNRQRNKHKRRQLQPTSLKGNRTTGLTRRNLTKREANAKLRRTSSKTSSTY